MKIMLFILFTCVSLYLVYETVHAVKRIKVAKQLIENAQPYHKEGKEADKAMLVLGDSTAVGVGATVSGDTLAARVASSIGALRVENRAVSGATTGDLSSQVEEAQRDAYELILIQIGGNDIIHFKNERKAGAELKSALEKLPEAEKVIVITAGNVGGSTVFPFFVRPLYTNLNLRYHAEFERIVTDAGFTYVDLYKDPKSKLMEIEPETYLAEDGLHPSSEGYGLWFEAIRPNL
jgi:lysophospholipase L1-like esterase